MSKGLRFGIGARVFLAFGAIVAGTVVSGVSASVMLSQIGGHVRQIGAENLPEVVDSLELRAHVGALFAAVPSLARAETESQRSDEWSALEKQLADAKEHLASLKTMMGDSPAMQSIAQRGDELSAALTRLHDAVGDRLMVSDQRNEAVRSVRRSFDRVRTTIGSAMEKVQGEIDLASMNLGADADVTSSLLLGLVATQIPLSQSLAELRGQTNQALNLLNSAGQLSSIEAVAAAQRDFKLIEVSAKSQLAEVEGLTKVDGMRASVEAVLLRGTAPNNLFNQRLKEVKAIDQGRDAMAEIRSVSDKLSAEVEVLVNQISEQSREAIAQSDRTIETGIMIVLAIAALSLVGAVLIATLYVARSLVGRIVALQHAMRSLADGDLSAEVPAATGGDEIANMAETVAVFKTNALSAQRLRAEQERERTGREERSVRLETLVHEFQVQLGTLVGEVGVASSQLDATAKVMSSVASQTTEQTATVASAAEEASVNVGTVATAADELAASIREISHQVGRSTEIANRATTEAARTDAVVRELSDGAQKIGDVVELITDIASQTNLLALNATIEAARAGEAGRGFAVVASEVKGLAAQTTRATEEIGQQITQIQAATRDAAAAINSIAGIIGEVSHTFTSIAAAIEQQGASTNEIARNVQQAAHGTRSVTETIADVSKGASETGAAASQVMGASAALARQSERLSEEVDRFIAGVKAA